MIEIKEDVLLSKLRIDSLEKVTQVHEKKIELVEKMQNKLIIALIIISLIGDTAGLQIVKLLGI